MSRKAVGKARRNITVSPVVSDMAQKVMAARGYGDFSAFIEELIRKEYDARFPAPMAQVEASAVAVAQRAKSRGEDPKP